MPAILQALLTNLPTILSVISAMWKALQAYIEAVQNPISTPAQIESAKADMDSAVLNWQKSMDAAHAQVIAAAAPTTETTT